MPTKPYQDIIDTLGFIEDKDERFAYIIDLAKTLPPLEEKYKTDAYRIEGCVSNLWLVSTYEEGKMHYQIDADAIITKGIGALLVKIYDALPPEEVLALDPAFLSEVGITQHLTPNRRNGLSNLTKEIYAQAEKARVE